MLLRLPGTYLTKACETQFLCRPDLGEVELQLWVCYIAVELKGSRPCLVSKVGERPQSILLPALWEAKKQLALHTALTAYWEHLLKKACQTQFLCRPDLAEVELQLWVCYIALELPCTRPYLVSTWREALNNLASSSMGN